MYPDLFTIPIVDWPVKSYGAMLTIGFLSGVWLSMKRAERLKADPDMILNVGMVCLLCGVAGARLFFAIHYWESSFANQRHPLFAALDCTGGGLEYYGGLIGAILGTVVYLRLKGVSLRLYVDILTPGAVWGLAFGRLGCLLNGCCWGGVSVDAHGHNVVPWGISFPHGSPAQTRQWENRQLTLPAELIVAVPGTVSPFILPADQIENSVEDREGPEALVRRLERRIREVKAVGGDESELRRLEARYAKAVKRRDETHKELAALTLATQMPSRVDPERGTTVTELAEIADRFPSRPVHPTQIYDIVSALLLSWVLLELLYRRRRHGIVFGTMCVLYPVTRIVLETVRVDNPHDSFGLTISQAISVGMLLFGVILLLYLRNLPLRSPRAIPYEPPVVDRPDDRS